eukprot:GHVL01042931.1.p1 GENE.GHVL01042931.1~~GHVL01042931.1.p1  ORF type:complete len:554 (+),score=136.04 GHVL01042931.1:285-1946(+)
MQVSDMVCGYVLRIFEADALQRRTSAFGEQGSISRDYDLRTNIGSGNFSQVQLAIERATGDRYAVKVMERAKSDKFRGSTNSSLDILSEIEMLKTLQHNNIVKLKQAYTTPTHIYLVTELLEGGDLLQRILDKGIFDEESTQRIFYDLCRGLQYLHDQGVVHRDMKPENILITDQSSSATVKISDFGLARYVPNERNCQTFCGTPHYFAPEMINTHQKKTAGYGKEVDLWSLGVILYILLSGTPPFGDDMLAEQITRGDYNFDGPEWENASQEAIELVKGLMKVEASERLTIEETIQHSWLMTARLNDLAGSDQSEAKENQSEAKDNQSEAKENLSEAKDNQSEAKENLSEAMENRAINQDNIQKSCVDKTSCNSASNDELYDVIDPSNQYDELNDVQSDTIQPSKSMKDKDETDTKEFIENDISYDRKLNIKEGISFLKPPDTLESSFLKPPDTLESSFLKPPDTLESSFLKPPDIDKRTRHSPTKSINKDAKSLQTTPGGSPAQKTPGGSPGAVSDGGTTTVSIECTKRKRNEETPGVKKRKIDDNRLSNT